MATDALVDLVLAEPGDPDVPMIEVLQGLVDDTAIAAAEGGLGIAGAARLVGLTSHTLRYYEQQGLLRPERNASGYRTYTVRNLRRLVFLSRMRLSGMTMHDLKTYIALVEQGESTIPARRRIMLEQRERIKRKLHELSLALEVTEYKIDTYGGHPED